MPVVDAHAHIYPEKIAAKAVNAIGNFYGVTMAAPGTAEALLKCTSCSDITHFIVHSVATSAKAVPTINNFIAEQARIHPEFIGFMTMHHEFDNMEAEVNRAIELGLRGVKIHPDTQMVNMDDPRLMQLYEIIEGKLPIVIHSGDYRYDYSSPHRLLRVLEAFPDLVVDAAHFGCWSQYEIGYDVLHTKAAQRGNVFLDESSSLGFLGPRRARELTHMWGCDCIMFGSDYPMWDPVAEYEQFSSAGFTERELDDLCWHNAERFIGSPIGR